MATVIVQKRTDYCIKYFREWWNSSVGRAFAFDAKVSEIDPRLLTSEAGNELLLERKIGQLFKKMHQILVSLDRNI
jgi:hypothetical protein